MNGLTLLVPIAVYGLIQLAHWFDSWLGRDSDA